MSVSFKSNAKDINKKGRVSLEVTNGCSPDISICKGKIVALNDGYFDLSVNFTAKARCPVGNVVLRLVASNDKKPYRSVASAEASDPCNNTLHFCHALKKGTKLALVLDSASGVGNFSLQGTIFNNAQRLADIIQLEKDMAFDVNQVFEYISEKPLANPPCPGAPYEDQANPLPVGEIGFNVPPPNNSPFIPWTANTIPWRSGQPSINGGIFANGQTVSTNYYRKAKSISYLLAFYAGVDFATIPDDDENLPVFAKDFEFRGPDNYNKLTYFYALTNDKLPFYHDKMDNLVNTIYTKVMTNNEPAISTFREELLRFFLDIHLGIENHPEFVLNYFRDFVDVVAYIRQPDKINVNDMLLKGRAIVPQVREYFAQRITEVIKGNDRSSIAYWWNESGLPLASVVNESLHNIIAFTQFANMFYLLVLSKFWANPANQAKYPSQAFPHPAANLPFWIPSSPIPYYSSLLGETLPNLQVDFFAKLKAAPTPEDRLNVIREAYRILLPNSAGFSTFVNPEGLETRNIQTRSVWFNMMVNVEPTQRPDPSAALRLLSFYSYGNDGSIYDATRHMDGYDKNFRTSVTNPPPPVHENDKTIINNNFIFSPLDNDPQYNDGTVLDINNPKATAIYNNQREDGLNFGYYPFGPAYRRCPGELFVYDLTERIMRRFWDVDWTFCEVDEKYRADCQNPCRLSDSQKCPGNTTFDIPPLCQNNTQTCTYCTPDNEVLRRYVAIAPRALVLNNIFPRTCCPASTATSTTSASATYSLKRALSYNLVVTDY